MSEGLAHVAHRGAGAIGDHVGDLCRVLSSISCVHILNDLFTAIALDVDVDVGWPIAFRREKAFEEQAEAHRISVGDAECVTDCRIRRAPASLAEDVRPTAELDEIPHHQEVAGKAEVLDEGQFVIDLTIRTGHPLGVFTGDRADGALAQAVATFRPLFGQPSEEGHLRQPARTGIGRQVRCHQLEIERTVTGDLRRPGDRTGIAGEPTGHLGPAAEMAGRRGGKPRIDVVERTAGPDRGQRSGQRTARRRRVVHVARGDQIDPGARGERGEPVVACRVERVTVVPQFDDHVGAAEHVDETVQLPSRGMRPMVDESTGDGTLATTGEYAPMPRVGVLQIISCTGYLCT